MKKYKKIIDIIAIVILIIIAIIVGINRTKLSDFNPINGDFQNYNPIRRFLDGQIPYKDFAVYLGSGHLILLSFFQLIIGNTFTRSLFVTNMVTVLCFELTIFIISYLILGNKRKAIFATLVMTLLNVYRPLFIGDILSKTWITALDSGVSPGNSARLIRKVIIPILVLLIYIGFKLIDKSHKIKNKLLIKKIYTAIIAGGAIAWSNDGGIASYISISFIYFLLLIKQHKKCIKAIVKDTFMYIGISIIALIILLTIITRGNPFSWFEYTAGVSSYQKWYYTEAINKKNISLTDIDISFENILMIGIAIYYIYKIFKTNEKNSVLKYSMLSFIVIASIISTYLYQLLSGGFAKEMLILVMLIIGGSYEMRLLDKINNKQLINQILKIIVIIIAVFNIVFNFQKQVIATKDARQDAVYNDKLEGYFSKYGDTIDYVTNRIKNEKIFSLYASAIEAATNQFQPTGIDYIIHVLGDEQREEYLQKFRQADFEYVADLSKDNYYRYWVRNSNWFFYRELYKNYKPTFVTEYNIFFDKEEKSDTKQINTNIKINRKNDSTYIIEVETDNETYDGIADVRLSYTSSFKENIFKTLDINRYVYINDLTTDSFTSRQHLINYNIPNKSDEYYLPITIINGKGKIQITVYPTNNAKLEINSAEVIATYDVMFRYCNASANKDVNGNNIYLDINDENEIILDDIKAVKIDDTIKKVIDYTLEGKYLKLELESDATEFAYPNFFEVIK